MYSKALVMVGLASCLGKTPSEETPTPPPVDQKTDVQLLEELDVQVKRTVCPQLDMVREATRLAQEAATVDCAKFAIDSGYNMMTIKPDNCAERDGFLYGVSQITPLSPDARTFNQVSITPIEKCDDVKIPYEKTVQLGLGIGLPSECRLEAEADALANFLRVEITAKREACANKK